MATITTAHSSEVANGIFRATAYTPPATWYVMLLTAVTDAAAGTVTEVSGGSYARQGLASDDTDFTIETVSGPARTRIANGVEIEFPAPTADWAAGGTQITHFGLVDVITAGSPAHVVPLDTPRNVVDGDPAPVFEVGELKIDIPLVITE